MSSYELINTSAHDTGLPDESVDAIITSPPFYSLRKYDGDQAVDWPEVSYSPMPGLPPLHIPAMRCELGLEPDPESYIGHLVLVMREMWRVLKSTGTAWVNLGDSYNGSGGAGGDYNEGGLKEGQEKYKGARCGELKPKDLMLIPQRFAFAVQADGWWVRSEIIWAKKAPMPESVTDRPTRSHEQIWLLSKAQRYCYDADAIREPLKRGMAGSTFTNGKTGVNGMGRVSTKEREEPSGRNRRDVWLLGPSPYPGAHFATFPPVIPETCIRAATSERGNCPECGKPWERVVEREANGSATGKPLDNGSAMRNDSEKWAGRIGELHTTTTGWQPTCDCGAGNPVSAVVLDPFVGSGTSVQAAIKLGRRAIGVDISATYLAELVPERVNNTQLQLIQ